MTAEITMTPPPRARLVLQVAGAFVAAAVIAVLVVLPAEYRIDPTGFGRLTGLINISGPQEIVVETRTDAPVEIDHPSDVPFRTDVVEITVPPLTENFGALEYKVSMDAGDSISYSWTAPKELLYEFHGHTPEDENGNIEVMNYRKATATESHGTLHAPITGIHGWFWGNSTLEPVTVELHLSGYYKLEPGIIAMER